MFLQTAALSVPNTKTLNSNLADDTSVWDFKILIVQFCSIEKKISKLSNITFQRLMSKLQLPTKLPQKVQPYFFRRNNKEDLDEQWRTLSSDQLTKKF